ncbi:hypothetical protein JKP88DRAFT_272827 [Tribonema minus]|uniref:Methyltransferase domain-containing protein n=1 Tax=Tribonema minus TaxID=303371 RepID=A0A835YZG7_9STRA|nr:hypothetical protein JKP88DRAFT_272827 [Tribonema minus]
MTTVDALLALAPRGCRVHRGQPDPVCDSLSVCSFYSSEGYESMNADFARNAFFARAIAATRCIRWLEVGIGADATLARALLSSRPDASLLGIDVNPRSAKLARLRLRSDFPAHRFQVLHSSSYDLQPDGPPADALLCEIVGGVASCEGIVDVVTDLRARGLISRACQVIPARAASFFAPVSLTGAALKRGDLFVADQFASVKPASFGAIAVSDDCGLLESYDLCTGESETSSTSHFHVNRDCEAHGFGIFIALTAPGQALSRRQRLGYETADAWLGDGNSVTSCHGCDGAATNWRTPVALFREPMRLRAGERLTVTSNVAKAERRCEYAFECAGRRVAALGTSDLYDSAEAPARSPFPPEHKSRGEPVYWDSDRSFPLLDAALCRDGEVFDLLLGLTYASDLDYQQYVRLLRCLAMRGDAQRFEALSETRIPLASLQERDRAALITCGVFDYLDRLEFEDRMHPQRPQKGDREAGLALLKLLWRSGPHGLGESALRLHISEQELFLLTAPVNSERRRVGTGHQGSADRSSTRWHGKRSVTHRAPPLALPYDQSLPSCQSDSERWLSQTMQRLLRENAKWWRRASAGRDAMHMSCRKSILAENASWSLRVVMKLNATVISIDGQCSKRGAVHRARLINTVYSSLAESEPCRCPGHQHFTQHAQVLALPEDSMGTVEQRPYISFLCTRAVKDRFLTNFEDRGGIACQYNGEEGHTGTEAYTCDQTHGIVLTRMTFAGLEYETTRFEHSANRENLFSFYERHRGFVDACAVTAIGECGDGDFLEKVVDALETVARHS